MVPPDVAAYAAEVARRVRETIGDDVVGVWLIGSLSLDDFDADRSDVDVLAVSAGRPPRTALEALSAALDHRALSVPARGLEFVLYARGDLAAEGGPRFSLNLNTGPRMERHVAFDAAEDPRFWFVVDVSIARQRGVPLYGPPAVAVLPELPRDLVTAALREALEWYATAGGSPVETVLAACRTLAWATDGTWRSKGDSGRFAAGRLTDPDPVLRALRIRDGAGDTPPTAAEVRSVLDVARASLDG
jgi:hypothetical protein